MTFFLREWSEQKGVWWKSFPYLTSFNSIGHHPVKKLFSTNRFQCCDWRTSTNKCKKLENSKKNYQTNKQEMQRKQKNLNPKLGPKQKTWKQQKFGKNTLLRVIPTMTCRVGVVRWGLSSTFIPWTGSRKLVAEKMMHPAASRMYLDSCLHLFLRYKYPSEICLCTYAFFEPLNSQDRGWGPARHTEHRIVVEVRHATLNSQDRGWGPARHTELTG